MYLSYQSEVWTHALCVLQVFDGCNEKGSLTGTLPDVSKHDRLCVGFTALCD